MLANYEFEVKILILNSLFYSKWITLYTKKQTNKNINYYCRKSWIWLLYEINITFIKFYFIVQPLKPLLPPTPQKKQKKTQMSDDLNFLFFSVFGLFASVTPYPCTGSSSGAAGTCYTTYNCDAKGGVADGTCFEAFSVCCVSKFICFNLVYNFN